MSPIEGSKEGYIIKGPKWVRCLPSQGMVSSWSATETGCPGTLTLSPVEVIVVLVSVFLCRESNRGGGGSPLSDASYRITWKRK